MLASGVLKLAYGFPVTEQTFSSRQCSEMPQFLESTTLHQMDDKERNKLLCKKSTANSCTLTVWEISRIPILSFPLYETPEDDILGGLERQVTWWFQRCDFFLHRRGTSPSERRWSWEEFLQHGA